MPIQTFEEIIKDIDAKKFQPVYFMYGEEGFFMDQITEKIERKTLKDYLLRRVSGEPIQYILGYTEFMGHRINLTLYKLDKIMEGDIDDIINEVKVAHNMEMLKSSGIND